LITLVLLLVRRRRDATKAMTTASLLGAIGVVPLDSGLVGGFSRAVERLGPPLLVW
jgi:hypothetical protein